MAIQARRIAVIKLNVASLAAALPLFTEQLGFVAEALAPGGSGAGNTIDTTGSVQCRGQIVHRPGVSGHCVLELLEWQRPAGEGPAYPKPWHTGISRLAIKVPDVDTLHGQLVAAGANCFAGPLTGAVSGERFFCCANNDGSILQFVQQGGPSGLHYVNLNCTDLLASSRWYQRLLGFEAESDIWDEALPGEVFGVQGVVHVRSQRLTLRDRETDCIIQLQQWQDPGTEGRPYPDAHHHGFNRVVLAVEDVDASYQQLLQYGVPCEQAPLTVGMAPVGGDSRVLFFHDPDGIRLQLIEAVLA